MKRLTAVLAAGLLVALAGAAKAGTIVGSAHDFTATGGTPIVGVTEVCATCHTPHRPVLNVPLWAHDLTTQSYNLYNQNAEYNRPNTAAYDASPTALAGSKSRLCLSCHDGTVAVAGATYMSDVMGGDAIITWNNGAVVKGGGATNDGLKGSHPIAIDYSVVRTNQAGEFNDIGTNADVKLDASSKLQCTTCHNPHNKSGVDKFLVATNVGSALCLTCHNK